MHYSEYIPGDQLKPYVKCYYTFESDSDAVVDDKAFATGCVEMMFNLGAARWQTAAAGTHVFETTPLVELWGQMTGPLTFRSLGKNTMLGIRFYPHTAAVFLREDISLFNDRVSGLRDILDQSIDVLHAQLLEQPVLTKRLELIEAFLLNRLNRFDKKLTTITMLGNVMAELRRPDFFDNIENVAPRYGITSRYLQKLFLQYTGLTPKLYSKINRFQNSLLLVAKKEISLTSIAYECGYSDQSHFIREFKSFTGFNPSAFNPAQVSAVLASPNK